MHVMGWAPRDDGVGLNKRNIWQGCQSVAGVWVTRRCSSRSKANSLKATAQESRSLFCGMRVGRRVIGPMGHRQWGTQKTRRGENGARKKDEERSTSRLKIAGRHGCSVDGPDLPNRSVWKRGGGSGSVSADVGWYLQYQKMKNKHVGRKILFWRKGRKKRDSSWKQMGYGYSETTLEARLLFRTPLSVK